MAMPIEQLPGGHDKTCYDVLGDVDAALRENLHDSQPYFVLGGVATGALVHPNSIIDKQSEMVIAAAGSGASLVRENGTRRDIDILVASTLPQAQAQRLKSAVVEAVDDQLEVSVFGFDQRQEHMKLVDRMKKLTVGGFTSKRTIDTQGIIRYELLPLERAVDPDSYKPWDLALPTGAHVNILSPAGQSLAYLIRSVSGLRHKDTAKAGEMWRRVYPDFQEEIRDGAFKDWLQFYQDGQSLRTLGRKAVVATHLDATALQADLFRFKSNLYKKIESHDALVNLAQRDSMQNGILKRFVGSL
jgi:hypothetical protein